MSDRFSNPDTRPPRAPELAAPPAPPEDPVSSLQKVAWRLEQIADTFDALALQLRDLAALVME